MNADASPDNPIKKGAALPGCAASTLNLLRLYGLVELALLAVVVYGLRAGWSSLRQWSDGFFLAGAIQAIVAAVTLLSPAGDALDASTLRYVPGGDVGETRFDLVPGTLRRKKFGL